VGTATALRLATAPAWRVFTEPDLRSRQINIVYGWARDDHQSEIAVSAYETRTRRVLDDLEAAFNGIAEFDVKRTFQAEKAVYGEAFLKVDHRLGTALLANREVLLVLADFPDVQVRNVEVTRDRLHQGAHRLQSSIAVVAHRDPEGNQRLRLWGREKGLTLLPLDLSQGVPKGENLLGLLLEDLYSYDRFDLTGPVRSDFQFFGRPFVPDMARRMSEGTIASLFGMRKIGKTSLLNRLADELTAEFEARVVFVDASDDSISSLSPAELFNVLSDAVDATAHGGYATPSATAALEDVSSTANEAQLFLESLEACESPIVLIVDEVDYLTPSSPTAPGWRDDFNPTFRALRRVYQEATRRSIRFSLVLSGVSSRWFTEESIGGVENAALALVPDSYLSPLTRDESIEMIETLGLACGLAFDRDAAQLLAATASDNPFWIRKAGSFINSCIAQSNRPERLRVDQVRTLCDDFIAIEGAQLAYSSLRHLFRIYPALGLTAVDAVFGNRDDLNEALISNLARYGIVGDELSASGPMVAAGLDRWKRSDLAAASKLPDIDDTPIAGVSAGSSSSAGEETWAEMLGEVSTLRNSVERRLRELILVVVRAGLADDKNRQPKDVILSALPSDRRGELSSTGASGILKRLFWLDLLAIVRRNWKWFERIFGDRGKLDLWGDIVNDRPDAHAKDFDGADLALQKRALEWFENAIDRSELL